MTTVATRSAAPVDSEFCYRLHQAALGPYVEEIWGWDEATQREFHQRAFDPYRTRIITVDGRDVGAITVDYRPTEVYLARLEILPDYQSRGIGARLVRDVLAYAASREQPVVLDLLVVNQRAEAFYRRLGFREVSRHGVNNVKIRMCAQPRA